MPTQFWCQPFLGMHPTYSNVMNMLEAGNFVLATSNNTGLQRSRCALFKHQIPRRQGIHQHVQFLEDSFMLHTGWNNNVSLS